MTGRARSGGRARVSIPAQAVAWRNLCLRVCVNLQGGTVYRGQTRDHSLYGGLLKGCVERYRRTFFFLFFFWPTADTRLMVLNVNCTLEHTKFMYKIAFLEFS